MEDKIKRSYEKINISDEARERIAMEITGKERKKTTFLMSRAKVAVAACLMLALVLPTGVYAAQKIYRYFTTTVQKQGEYHVDMKMQKTEKQNSDPVKQQYIKLTADFGDDYILEKDHAMMSYQYKERKESGKDFWYELQYLDGDMQETISNYDIADHETMTINGRKAVYCDLNSVVGTKYKNEDRYKTSYSKVLYIFIEDYGYILEFAAENGLAKEDFIHLAETVTIEPTDNKDDASEYVLFSESQNASWHMKSEAATQMEEIKYYDTKEATYDHTTYRVKKVQVLDNINGLDQQAFITKHFDRKSLVTQDGKLKKYDRELLQWGDGVESPEQKVAKTEKIQSKLVYVTLEVKNSAANAQDGKFYIPSLQFVTKENGKIYAKSYDDDYNRPEKVEDALTDLGPCYVKDNLGGKSSWAVKASTGTITIQVAYLVDEDFTDGVALWLNDSGSSAEEKHCLIISQINP